ncbi:unnamed protein product [Linum trigynum]|uniref:Uncharacterized protein n=1 Tax=Linum trigynum TaxID=586398 RepID=A0AAV2D9V1_9ROSI
MPSTGVHVPLPILPLSLGRCGCHHFTPFLYRALRLSSALRPLLRPSLSAVFVSYFISPCRCLPSPP